MEQCYKLSSPPHPKIGGEDKGEGAQHKVNLRSIIYTKVNNTSILLKFQGKFFVMLALFCSAGLYACKKIQFVV